MRPRLASWPSAVLLTLVLLASAGVSRAEAQAARDAALVLRVLSYDRNLGSRAPSRRDILTVYAPGDRASERSCRDLAAAITALGARVTVADRRVRATPHAYQDPETLARAMRSAVAVFVCSGLEGSIGAIAGESRARSVLTLTSVERQVDAGLAVGILAGRSQMRLVVNLPASRAEGARLDAALLRLCEVRR
jgi:hypothetical protein